MRTAVVVGNPKPASRTLGVARAAAAGLARAGVATGEVLEVDLAESRLEMFDPTSERLGELSGEVAACRLAIFASPTYKAAYTGLLKAFLDRYGNNGLAGVVAVPVMTGAAPIHALAVEVHLRPVLVELGATVPCRGLYVTEGELGRLDEIVAAWALDAAPLVRAALG